MHYQFLWKWASIFVALMVYCMRYIQPGEDAIIFLAPYLRPYGEPRVLHSAVEWRTFCALSVVLAGHCHGGID
eukprot:5692213-Amphidinium_carterae.1